MAVILYVSIRCTRYSAEKGFRLMTLVQPRTVLLTKAHRPEIQLRVAQVKITESLLRPGAGISPLLLMQTAFGWAVVPEVQRMATV